MHRVTRSFVRAGVEKVLGLSAVILVGVMVTACEPLERIWPLAGDQLVVSSRPRGAIVFIDGKEMGRTPAKLKLEPGEHLISLSLEHYAPWEDVVNIRAGEAQRIEPTLVFMPYSVRISETLGKSPVWSSGSQVYFIRSMAGGDQVVRIEVEQPLEESDLFSVNGRILTEGSWSPDGKQLLITSSTGDALGLLVFDLRSGKRSLVYHDGEQKRLVAIADFSAIAAWGSEGEVYFVLYRKGPDWDRDNPYDLIQEIWKAGRDRSKLEMLYDFSFPVVTGLAWVPGGGLLLEEYNALLRMTPSEVVPLPLVDSTIIKASEWASDGSHIAYLWAEQESSFENTLTIMDADGGQEEQLIKTDLAYFHWMPGSKWLVYFTYSTPEDGSSCWAVDVETGERILLADPGILKQRVGDFSVSPDGRRIAFEGEDGNIWLLVLDETREPRGLLDSLSEWRNLLR